MLTQAARGERGYSPMTNQIVANVSVVKDSKENGVEKVAHTRHPVPRRFPIFLSAFQSQTIDFVLNRLATRHDDLESRLINRQQPVLEHGGVVLR